MAANRVSTTPDQREEQRMSHTEAYSEAVIFLDELAQQPDQKARAQAVMRKFASLRSATPASAGSERAVAEKCAEICAALTYSKEFHFDPSGAWCGGATAATRNCVEAIRAYAATLPAAPQSERARSDTTKDAVDEVVDRAWALGSLSGEALRTWLYAAADAALRTDAGSNKVPEDTARLDYLELEDGAGALFRRNLPITRAAIDAAMLAACTSQEQPK